MRSVSYGLVAIIETLLRRLCVFKLKKIFFLFGCAGSLLLRVAFTGCSEWQLLFIVVHRLLLAVASLVEEHRLRTCGDWA